jgi:cytochrome P450
MGKHLAMAEMRLIIAKLVWTFDMKAVRGRVVRWEDLRTFLLVEKEPVYARLSARASI